MTKGKAPPARSIRIAILAMGGEGGGVLADWIVDLAEHGRHIAQATSVPGVAQRTGATIYYLELFDRALAGDRAPVLAMTPVPGDVDIVIASELMEAGRAVQRGIVTPDRTLLIASIHRVFAMTEKITLSDGRTDAPAVLDACRTAARQLIAFDMAAIAENCGSVISAAMFGALAGSGALPFARDAFEETIARGRVGADASMRAFAAAFEAATGAAEPSLPQTSTRRAAINPTPDAIGIAFAPAATPIIKAGFERLIDFQDNAYAGLYIERLKPIADLDLRFGDGSHRLLIETARQLALGMAYEDTIRVADLKTRASRFARVRDEVNLKDGQILQISEFLHPRLQEIAESAPAALGRMMLRQGPLRWLVERLTAKGRIVTTTSITGFLLLYLLARMKPLRRRSLRFAGEQQHLESWLAHLSEIAPRNYELALELAECRNLVKGYGDTHARGRANYARIIGLVARLRERPQAEKALADLRRAALADESGSRLNETIAELGLR